jgi:hypothetical protein
VPTSELNLFYRNDVLSEASLHCLRAISSDLGDAGKNDWFGLSESVVAILKKVRVLEQASSHDDSHRPKFKPLDIIVSGC